MQQPAIIEKPQLHVVGFEAPFISVLSPDANNFQVIGELWSKICDGAKNVSNRFGDNMFGIVYAIPEHQRSHPHELKYVAAVAVDSPGDVPDGMVARTIDAGTFAVFKHVGPIRTLGETCDEIYRKWLPQSDFVPGNQPDIEVYGAKFNSESDDSEMEYCVSIIPST